MYRALKNRIHRLEELAADGRADGYILAERVRHAAGGLVLWRFQRQVVPNLPDPPRPDEPQQVPTAVLRDIAEPLTAHDPNYAPPFKPKHIRRRPRPKQRAGARPEDTLPPSMHVGADRRERPIFFEEKPYVEPYNPEPLW